MTGKSLTTNPTESESNLVGILLKNGFELIGKLVEENDEYLLMEDVLKVMYDYRNENTMPAMFLYKYTIFSNDNNFTFNKNDVYLMYDKLDNGIILFYKDYLKYINDPKYHDDIFTYKDYDEYIEKNMSEEDQEEILKIFTELINRTPKGSIH